jgi:GxxExxY protein
MEYLHQDLTDKIIKVFYEVYSELGFGFLEKVYQKAMNLALEQSGLTCRCQEKIKVIFRGNVVGEYFSDIVVNDCVILELKACEALVSAHETQLLNYLRSTNIEIGLLLNFGVKPEIKRKIFTNDRKKNLLHQCRSV